jgi:hypothetical protein
MRRCLLIAGLLLAAGCTSEQPPPDDTAAAGADSTLPVAAADPNVAEPTAPSADTVVFFRAARVLDLTGRGARDSVVLTARGERLDSLAVRLSVFAEGREAYTESWGSSYELALEDSVRGAGNEAIATYLRSKFESELAAVERRPFDREQLELMGDTAVLREFASPISHEIVFAYGYETTVVLAYDEDDGVFRKLRSCC